MSKGKILFQLTGSIACFKACQLLSQLVKAGYEVEVVASRGALEFVGAATLEGLTGRKVHVETFARGEYMQHIRLMRWAELVLLCPATANILNKLAAGIADDLIGTLFLAHDFQKPYLVAPAMNEKMLLHPATHTSLETLKAWGVRVLPTESGALACGETGGGRMIEPDEILAAVEIALGQRRVRNAVRPLSILITSGGTREPIDGVRSIANFSTGRTGAAIAERLAADGHQVTLLRARDAARARGRLRNLRERLFVTFKDLQDALRDELANHEYDAVLHAAAVSDFSVNSVDGGVPGAGKLESTDKDVVLRLSPNPKLIDGLRALSRNPAIKVVGFKLTNGSASAERRAAVHKLALRARPDFIVHNDLSEISANGASHLARIFAARDPGDLHEIASTESKERLAETLERVLKGGFNDSQS